MRWIVTLVACVFVLGGLSAAAQVDEAQPLEPGTPVITRIEAGASTNFAIAAQAGTIVTISVRSLELADALDPMLRLIDLDGRILAMNDDHFSPRIDLRDQDALIEGFTLPETGVYVVQVDTPTQAQSGSFEIVLTIDAYVPTPVPPMGILDGDTVVGEVPDNGVFRLPLLVEAGDEYQITARTLDGIVDPRIEVVALDGSAILVNDDHGSDDPTLSLRDARIQSARFNTAGAFEIRVSGFAGIGGRVAVSIRRVLEPTLMPTLTPTLPPNVTPTPVPMTEAQILTEELQTVRGIVNPYEAYIYQFDAQAGDVYTITARTRSNGFDPRVALYFGDQLIAANEDNGTSDSSLVARDARIYNLILTRTGHYEAHVRGYGETSGDFILSLERVARNAPLTTGMTQTIAGSVPPGNVTEFRFDALPGDYVTAVVRGNGEFDPRLMLFTRDGILLYSNNDHGMIDGTLGLHDALIPNYRIEIGGQYVLQVAGTRGLAGEFTLTLNIKRGA